MPNYPEYAWIQDSIDATTAETEKVRALIEELRKTTPNPYYSFPEHLRKNPTESIFIELESGKELSILECRLSEN